MDIIYEVAGNAKGFLKLTQKKESIAINVNLKGLKKELQKVQQHERGFVESNVISL